jgi:hypothetical protein
VADPFPEDARCDLRSEVLTMNVTSLLKVFDEELEATLSDDPVSFWRCEPIFTRLLA